MADGEETGMSVFGGDSWARDAQQRKRRLDDLILPVSASSSPSTPNSFRRLPSGKLACLVCPHRPVLDSPLMLSMHNKGAWHIAAESRLKEKELSRKHEVNKRLALSSDASHSNSGNPHTSIRPTNIKEKPLIEHTWRAILEAQSSRFNDFNGKKVSHDLKCTANTSSCDSHIAPSDILMEKLTGSTGSIQCNSSKEESSAGNQIQGNLLFQIGKQKPGNARRMNFGSLLRAGNEMAMEDGTEMKMLNLIRMKMILTYVSADHLRRRSESSNLMAQLGTSNSSQCNVERNQAPPKAVELIVSLSSFLVGDVRLCPC